MKIKYLFLLFLLAYFSTSISASADEGRRFHERHFEEFHDRDVHLFYPRELHRWRRGRWVQAIRGGVNGWWWVIGPRWYYYPAPVYPYPLMVSERVVFIQSAPPVVAVPPSPPVSPQGTTVVAPAAAPQVRYFCSSLNGYYPQVPQCPEPWRSVNPIPPGPISP
ncbi:MAG: hypothetical protein KGN31_06780 [Betaproteobacteria bacterium]|nr:hypothetical protein [Betaproteobacteria bacterium]MDE2423899.1 hypothetical protein [Betaproteobacteria bacterium]